MNRQQLSHWDYVDDDYYNYKDRYDYMDYEDHYNSYLNNNYPSNSYRNGGGRYQPSSKGSNGKGGKSNAGPKNNQKSVSRPGQQTQALNDEPTVDCIGFLEVVPSSSTAIPSKSTISKMVPSGSNVVVNVININHNY